MARTEIETWLAGPGRKHVEAAASTPSARQLVGNTANILTAFLASMLEDGTAEVTGQTVLRDGIGIETSSAIIIKLEAQ